MGWVERFNKSFQEKKAARGEIKTTVQPGACKGGKSAVPGKGRKTLVQPGDTQVSLSAPRAQNGPSPGAAPKPRRLRPWLRFRLPDGATYRNLTYDAKTDAWSGSLEIPGDPPETYFAQTRLGSHQLQSDLGWLWFHEHHPNIPRPENPPEVLVDVARDAECAPADSAQGSP